MGKPTVSIITPAFNCAETISETYASILKQSFYDWEWVVVEDHSTDNTYDIICDLVKDDERVVVLRTSKNSGAATARNHGISFAHGKYIAFLDADDLWMPEKLEEQISFMASTGIPFSFTDYEALAETGKKWNRISKKDVVTYKNLLHKCYIGCLTVMYDSEAIGKRYMPLDCEKREDHGAWLDITKDGIDAVKLPKILATYKVNSHSVSSNKFRMIKYQYRLFRRHEKFSPFMSFIYTCVTIWNKLISR